MLVRQFLKKYGTVIATIVTIQVGEIRVSQRIPKETRSLKLR
jgi:hypothetical protein